MSQPCAVDSCKRASRALCHCCQQNVCVAHLNEHSEQLNAQLDPLVDEINALGARLSTFDIQKKTANCREKLEQWRVDCHEKIDLFFEEKCQELDQLISEKVDKQRQEITRVQSVLVELVREQEATRQYIDLLTSNIHHLEIEMNNIEQCSIQTNTRPLLIDVDCIHINEINDYECDLSTLSPVFKTISRTSGSDRALTSNDRYLLFHKAPNLCLVDRDLTLINEIFWCHGQVIDMCWSSTLDRFIVIGRDNICLINGNTMSVEIIETSKKGKWISCTCSDTSLFLSTRVHGSSIVELNLLSPKNLVREWKCPDSCAKTEDITCIMYNNETLALLIRNNLDRTMKMELKSATTFDRIWSLQLDVVCNQDKTLRCCSLTNDEWLIADYETRCLMHISKDGKIKGLLPYNEIPWYVNLFGPDILAVSIRNHGLNFHKIRSDF
jgi:hypothetical protein